MRIVSHMLILVLIVSLYVGYCRWQSSYYYALAAVTERQNNWPETVLFAGKAGKANVLDDLPLHTLGRALLELGYLELSIAITRKALAVRPYKKYLIHNLKQGMAKFKAKQSKE